MDWLDAKLLDGVLSLRDAGLLIAYGFALGIQIGHGAWRLADLKSFFRTLVRR